MPQQLPDEPEDDPTREDLARPASALEGPYAPRLVMMRGPEVGRSFSLLPGATTIGRAPGNHISIDETDVSRRHCSISDARSDTGEALPEGQLWLSDLGSTNGTWIGDLAVGRAGLPVGDGALIRLGRGLIFKLSLVQSIEDRVQDALFDRAVRDALTGAYTRGFTEDRLQRELSACRKAARTLSILMIDIDFFKRVNDTLGHDAGDQVLQHVRATLERCLRAHDLLGRWGGEEFMVILLDTPLHAAELLAERLRAAVSATPVPYKHRGVEVTVSLGVASSAEDPDASWRDLYVRADRRLYLAKANGRNRFVSVDPVDPAARSRP